MLPKDISHELIFTHPIPLDHNPSAVYLASLKPSGRRSQKQALDKIASLLTDNRVDCLELDWSKIRYQHTTALRSKLVEMYKPATVNKYLSALRRTLKECWRLGLISAEIYQRAADVENVSGETIPAGRELSEGEILSLMKVCANDPSPAGVRDAALIAILYGCGLRREEVTDLGLDNYDMETGRLLITGKQNRERNVFLVGGAIDTMRDWLEIRGYGEGPLFCGINKGGTLNFRKISSQAIYNMLRKRGKESDVKSFSPHDLRRTFVSDLLDAGADIATVARMAGHTNVQTTARYDRRPETAKKRAAGLLHVPYIPRR